MCSGSITEGTCSGHWEIAFTCRRRSAKVSERVLKWTSWDKGENSVEKRKAIWRHVPGLCWWEGILDLCSSICFPLRTKIRIPSSTCVDFWVSPGAIGSESVRMWPKHMLILFRCRTPMQYQMHRRSNVSLRANSSLSWRYYHLLLINCQL